MRRSSSDDANVKSEKIGKLLSSYYHDEGQSELSPMSSMVDGNSHTVNSVYGLRSSIAENSSRQDPLEVTLTKWRTATTEEHKLKTEAKGLLYENCDKFFACVGLIARLNKDVSKVQSQQMREISDHSNSLATNFRKISSIHDQDPVKSAETQFLHALEASDLLNLPTAVSEAAPVQAVKLYMQFVPFFSKFQKFPLIRTLQEAARVPTAAAFARLVNEYEVFNRRGVDELGNFQSNKFPTRLADLVYVLEAAPKILGKGESEISANLARLAVMAEAQVAEKALKEAMAPGIFLEEILSDIFNRGREISDKISFPQSLLDLVIPCIRDSALRLVETGKFPSTIDAENFCRRVSYYFRFAKDVVDVDKFFQDACECWTTNCFTTARGNFMDDFSADAISDHQVRLLQTRAIAAAAESAKLYGRFEMDEEFPGFVLGKIKAFVYACLCGQDTDAARTGNLIQLHRHAEMKNTYQKILLASLEDYLEQRQLEISAKEISDHVKHLLYPRYLKQWASALATDGTGDLGEQVDKILAMIDDNTRASGKNVVHRSSKGNVNLEIVQAERLLARRMELTGKTGEWRVVFFRHLIKTAVERRRAGLGVAVQSGVLASLVDKTVQSEGHVTLKAMLEDLKEAETLN